MSFWPGSCWQATRGGDLPYFCYRINKLDYPSIGADPLCRVHRVLGCCGSLFPGTVDTRSLTQHILTQQSPSCPALPVKLPLFPNGGQTTRGNTQRHAAVVFFENLS